MIARMNNFDIIDDFISLMLIIGSNISNKKRLVMINCMMLTFIILNLCFISFSPYIIKFIISIYLKPFIPFHI